MSAVSPNLKYTAAHGWFHPAGSMQAGQVPPTAQGTPAKDTAPGAQNTQDAHAARIGITAHAAEQLGDIIFVELPAAGTALLAGQIYGEVESTKSVSELHAPVSGLVVAVNEAVVNDPTLINSDPYGAGWLLEVATTDVPADLLSPEEYLGTTS